MSTMTKAARPRPAETYRCGHCVYRTRQLMQLAVHGVVAHGLGRKP